MRPFLEEFFSRGPARVSIEAVSLGARVNLPGENLLARPEGGGRLPALLVLFPPRGPSRKVLSEFAEVGYLALGVPAPAGWREEPRIALRWLRERADVSLHRIGLVDFSGAADLAWTLAREERLQACVLVCRLDALPQAGTRGDGPPLLAVAGSGENAAPRGEGGAGGVREGRPGAAGDRAFKLLAYPVEAPGFLLEWSPSRSEHNAEAAWFEIYEFLGTHVEDAGPARPHGAHPLRVVDIMRAVNSPRGLRGELASSLLAAPADDQEWDLARARAAILAESARILEGLPPPRGNPASWRERGGAFRAGADLLLERVSARDLEGARAQLEHLSSACGACHQAHR